MIHLLRSSAIKIEYLVGRLYETLVIYSAYLPFGDSDQPPSEEWRRLAEYCEIKRWPLLIGCDANARYTLWGSRNINRRGEFLFDYLITTDLTFLNRGSTATFVTERCQEVIDLISCSANISDHIKE